MMAGASPSAGYSTVIMLALMGSEADGVKAGSSAGYGTLIMLVLLIAASVWLGAMAQRVVERGSFMKGYFLGHRGLGSWTLALTATVQSGGTFMGFPSLVYSYGW